MLIIIEGCDGVGKTTLAETIAARITDVGEPAEILHYGPPERHPLDEYELDLVDYTPGGGLSIIADRYHLGELVYAPLYRNESPLGGYAGSGRAHVELFLAARGAVVVHVDGNEADVRSRLVERGEDFLDLKDIGTVLHEFRTAARTSLCTHVRVPMFWDETDVNRVLLAAGSAETMAARVWTRNYVGTLRPKVLLVGMPQDKIPFIPHEGTVGEFVLDSLGWRTNATLGLASVGITDVEKLAMQYRAKVVAVGETVSAVLHNLSIPHGAVVYPGIFLHRPDAVQAAKQHFPASFRKAATHGKKFTWTP